MTEPEDLEVKHTGTVHEFTVWFDDTKRRDSFFDYWSNAPTCMPPHRDPSVGSLQKAGIAGALEGEWFCVILEAKHVRWETGKSRVEQMIRQWQKEVIR